MNININKDQKSQIEVKVYADDTVEFVRIQHGRHRAAASSSFVHDAAEKLFLTN